MLPIEGLDQQLLSNLSFRKWSTLASLVLLLWEYIITLADEIRHIWCRPFNAVKAAYIFARYFGLVVQIVNLYLVFGPLHRLYTPEHVCKQWFLFLVASVCVLIDILDIILMLRVYALYRKDWRAAAFLVVLFCTQMALEGVVAPRTVLHVPYDRMCDTTKTHPDVIYAFVSIWVTHIALGILTAAKWKLVKIRAPVMRVVTRDGALTTISICSLYTAIISYSLFSQVSQAHIVFSWPITLLSIASSRLIMNLQTLDISGDQDSMINCISTTDFDVASFDTLRLGFGS